MKPNLLPVPATARHRDTPDPTMSDQKPKIVAQGGCQCGAVRYSVERFGRSALCHCRMCQKAFGGFFGPLVEAYGVQWTGETPSYFSSSQRNRRGFCAKCGTPLSYEFDGGIEIAIGSLDDPEQAPPTFQVNVAYRCSFFPSLCALPVEDEENRRKNEAWNAGVVSNQHPDRDHTE